MYMFGFAFIYSDADSVSFSGDSLIQYEVLEDSSSSRRRQTRQSQLHQTGRDYVSLAFITSSHSGTILVLGTDSVDEEHAILEVLVRHSVRMTKNDVIFFVADYRGISSVSIQPWLRCCSGHTDKRSSGQR